MSSIFWDKVAAYERQLIIEALLETGGRIGETAAKLGLFRSVLQRKMKKLGITREAIYDAITQLEREGAVPPGAVVPRYRVAASTTGAGAASMTPFPASPASTAAGASASAVAASAAGAASPATGAASAGALGDGPHRP